jgi:nucleotide-binding universal stress UspA family protein
LNVIKDLTEKPVNEKAKNTIKQKLEGINYLFHFLENEDQVYGINEFAIEIHANMIVILPHKHTLWDSVFHESNTKKLAFHTTIPILALPNNIK